LAGFYLETSLDSRDDRLNPTSGFNINARIMPLYGMVENEQSNFIELEGSLATYYAIDEAKRYVLAGRTRLGTVVSSEHQKVPDNHRFYAGGAGSVRGYDRDIIGPLDAKNNPEGGRFVFELGAEIRAQIYGDIGLALFAESALVDEQPNPQADTRMQTGVGVGVRYYSPVGPVRLDLAIPLEKREVDADFELYISLGQAF
jgi:Outer membrane protein